MISGSRCPAGLTGTGCGIGGWYTTSIFTGLKRRLVVTKGAFTYIWVNASVAVRNSNHRIGKRFVIAVSVFNARYDIDNGALRRDHGRLSAFEIGANVP